jgi:hypothetical protein
MICLIQIDESAIDVSTAAQPSHLCVHFFEKLGGLLDRLDNRHTMHSFQYGAREQASGNPNDARYCSVMTFHGL